MELVGVRLAEAMQRGAVLVFVPDPEHPIIRCLSPAAKRAVDPLLDPAIKPAAQALMRHVVVYRRTLLGLFRLNGTETPTTEAEAADGCRLVAEEMRLLDDLGPALADAVRAQVAAEYLDSTGRCPLCGGCRHAA
jgi:hypothetical protein